MPPRIRVLHPITRMILGGAQLNTLYTCQLLDRSRFEPALLTGPELGPEGDLLGAARELDIPVHVVPALGREIRPIRDLAAYRAIHRHLATHEYDIVHTHISKAGILGRRAAWRNRVPVIVHTAHGWQWTLAKNPAMRRFIIAAEKWAARFSDKIIVVAEGDREKGLQEGVGRADQYVVIESSIPMEEYDPHVLSGDDVRAERGIPPGARVAGTVGRFSHPKEPEVMLRAARRILESDPEAHFIYVGNGPKKEKCLAEVGDFRNHPRLHLLGLRRDVPRVVAAFDVFLLSSSSEGLPRVIAEAMALEKPVVSTPAGAVPDLVQEEVTGHLVPFGDDEGLARAALLLLADRPRARILGKNGRQLVIKRFDVKEMVHRIEDLYMELLTRKGHG